MPIHMPLPLHGRITCRKCFAAEAPVQEVGLWQVVNDPGAWGAAEPTALVLGFSKGFTQAAASLSGNFESIPFKNMRPRLSAALRRIGLLSETDVVDAKFSALEERFAFGSLVRCSLSRFDVKTGRRGCTGDIMPKAFIEPVRDVVRRCADTFLSQLPESVRVVVMLGTGNAYMSGCSNLIRTIYGSGFQVINEVAYETPGVIWVHITHPSGMNGYFNPWIAGDRTNLSGRKMLKAMEALAGLNVKISTS